VSSSGVSFRFVVRVQLILLAASCIFGFPPSNPTMSVSRQAPTYSGIVSSRHDGELVTVAKWGVIGIAGKSTLGSTGFVMLLFLLFSTSRC